MRSRNLLIHNILSTFVTGLQILNLATTNVEGLTSLSRYILYNFNHSEGPPRLIRED